MSEKCNRELRNFYFSGLLKWQTWVIPYSDMHYHTSDNFWQEAVFHDMFVRRSMISYAYSTTNPFAFVTAESFPFQPRKREAERSPLFDGLDLEECGRRIVRLDGEVEKPVRLRLNDGAPRLERLPKFATSFFENVHLTQ